MTQLPPISSRDYRDSSDDAAAIAASNLDDLTSIDESLRTSLDDPTPDFSDVLARYAAPNAAPNAATKPHSARTDRAPAAERRAARAGEPSPRSIADDQPVDPPPDEPQAQELPQDTDDLPRNSDASADDWQSETDEPPATDQTKSSSAETGQPGQLNADRRAKNSDAPAHESKPQHHRNDSADAPKQSAPQVDPKIAVTQQSSESTAKAPTPTQAPIASATDAAPPATVVQDAGQLASAAQPSNEQRNSQPPTAPRGDSTRPDSNEKSPAQSGETESRTNSTSSNSSSPAPASVDAAPTPAPMSGNTSATATTFLEMQPQADAHASSSGAGGAKAAATATPAQVAHAAASTGGEEFAPQMVRGALAMTRTTGGAMTIRLEPAALGSLRIQMQMTQGRVSVQFHAETAQARGLLTQNVETLRQALESQGLKLETVQIHTLARSAGSSHSSGQDQQQPQSQAQSGEGSSARHDAGGQQSRGHGDTAEREAQYRQAARQFRNSGQRTGAWREHWDQQSSQPQQSSIEDAN